MTEPAQFDAVAFTVEQSLLAIDSIRDAWAWLCLLVEPGRETSSSGTAVDDQQAERLEALGRSDRAYREHNLRHGMSALPPSPAAARLAVIDAKIAVHDQVAQAVWLLAGTSSTMTTSRAAAAARDVPAALDWLGGWEVGLGITGRDGVWLRPGALARVRDPQLAADVDKLLQRADRTARATAQITDERVRPIEHRCPACGRRSLQLEMTGADRTKWLVRCVSERCLCTASGEPGGPAACGCLRRADVLRGHRHAWTYGDLDGRGGLLAALETYDRQRPAVGSGASGHGGWQSRNMANR